MTIDKGLDLTYVIARGWDQEILENNRFAQELPAKGYFLTTSR